MQIESLDTIYHDFFSAMPVHSKNNRIYTLPELLGEGGFKRVKTFSGLEIVYSNFFYKQQQIKRFSSEHEMVEIQFMLEGESEIWVKGSNCNVNPGTSSFLFMKDFEVSFEFPELGRIKSLSIGLPVQLFDYYLAQYLDHSHAKFEYFLLRQSFKQYELEIDPIIEHLIHRIVKEISAQDTSAFIIEAKALELLNRSLHLLMFDSSHVRHQVSLSRNDTMKLRKAAELITSKMDYPPTLLELARSVGLNDYKLKVGFKEYFGTTVFGYLRKKRMDHAFDLLCTEKRTITEVASEVGYTNLSAFSKCFRDTFGITPSHIKRYY
ncbi:helix-turn-helix transcriptional regulator [Bacillus sp. WMMC1349]|uniref:helix-turn-helix transcriptional regulator n=1 Tax=Bacillus sp. WMMC1349 TaxID=2736254 RepID=UPI001555A45F|nr:AraC family transcriptional regulator [Bacillus sp. WMMC1349]NPC91326.1 helix-turn-helix transcriptional regulator [Bacillus sp. WMMC1349]